MKGTYLLSEDAGGTMTDAFLMDDQGRFIIGKASTTRYDESVSFTEAVADAARGWNLGLRDALARTGTAIYSGTAMLNILLTRTGSKVGLIVTKGFEDYVLHQRGLNWAEYSYEDRLHSATHACPPELVPRRLVKGVTGRVNMFGVEVIPLYEEEVREAARRLIEEGVESIGISFLFSYMNPSHEMKAKQIVQEVLGEYGKSLPVHTGWELAPITREHSRLNSVLIQSYAAEPLRAQLFRIEEKAKEQGYGRDLFTLAGYGGVINIRHPRLFESVTSGPIGGLIGARRIADLLGIRNMVAMDMGGTSFDVSIITDGVLPVERDSTIARYNLNLPSLSIHSIGAGAGMVIRIDPVSGRLTFGPDSAEAKVGACLDYDEPTISDCNVILGYLNPEYFLGGKVRLDRQRAVAVFQERIADPLGLDVYRAASDVLDLLHVRIREHVRGTLRGRGYDPADYHVAVYGGAGPLHLWGMVEGVPFQGVMTFQFAAAFSAFGIANCDYVHRYHKGVFVALPPGANAAALEAASRSVSHAYEAIEKEAFDELVAEGFSRDEIRLRHIFYARYLGQLEDVEAVSPVARIDDPSGLDLLVEAFEQAYRARYPLAARSPEAGYQITEVAVEAFVPMVKPRLAKQELGPPSPGPEAAKGKRTVRHRKESMEFDIWEMDLLGPGNEVRGPSIIEHPMTTLVIPPGYAVRFDEYGLIRWEQIRG